MGTRSSSFGKIILSLFWDQHYVFNDLVCTPIFQVWYVYELAAFAQCPWDLTVRVQVTKYLKVLLSVKEDLPLFTSGLSVVGKRLGDNAIATRIPMPTSMVAMTINLRIFVFLQDRRCFSFYNYGENQTSKYSVQVDQQSFVFIIL